MSAELTTEHKLLCDVAAVKAHLDKYSRIEQRALLNRVMEHLGAVVEAQRAAVAATPAPSPADCDWPDGGLFTFHDEPGEHDPCYVVMPGGAMLSLNHHAAEGVDIARAKFIVAACNAALSPDFPRDVVAQAMQDAWNTICTDTGCHPLDIERKGKELFFKPHHWVDLISLFLVPKPNAPSFDNTSAKSPTREELQKTIWGTIAAVYGELDEEDCAWIDRVWANQRGYILPTDGTSTISSTPCTPVEFTQCEACWQPATCKKYGCSNASTDQPCAKCGCETKGEAALVGGQVWCHPCADGVASKLCGGK